MNYKEWEETIPEAIKSDSLWKMIVYRQALFIDDLLNNIPLSDA